MRDAIRVVVLGTGQMGSGIARLILAKEGLALVGVCARRSARAGKDAGEVLGLERPLGLPVRASLDEAIEHGRPDIAIQATCSRVADAAGEIGALVARGVNVISIAEGMAFPACSSPEEAARLHESAIAGGATVLGTGVNPGFVLDLLVIALSGACADIEAITARRVNDLAPYGPSVLATQGVGLTPGQFARGLADGSVVGHFGFEESVRMIARAVGWDIDRVDQTREPIVSSVRRETDFVTVEPGQVAGCFHTATALRRGEPVITLIHPQQIHPHLEDVDTGDTIEIRGTPSIRLAGSPEIPGGQAPVALAVNMIPRVLDAAPGLKTMADLPVPAAILGDARRLLRGGA